MKKWFGTLLLLALTATLAPAQIPAEKAGGGCCSMMNKSASVDDAKLQAMLDDMNKAQGQAKVDKMAAVITELVAQRAAMQSGGGCCSMKKGSMAGAMECH